MKKMNATFATLLALSFMLTGTSALAAAKLHSACKKELKQFGCKTKSDDEAHTCLQQHEQAGKPHSGFSKKCYDAHEAYEKAHGKTEANEAAEHKEGETKE